MTAVELEYEIQYTMCELADERVESKPMVRLYFDTHLERSEADGGIQMLAFDEHNLKKKYKGVLRARSISRLENKVPATMCIGMAQFAQRRNEYGFACYTNAGSTHIKMKDLLACVERGETYDRELPLRMENLRINGGDALEKGRVRVIVKKLSIGRDIKIIKESQCALGAPVDEIATMLTDFISARMEDEAQIPDTWGEQTANVRAPMDISNTGIELTEKCFLPIEAFALNEPMVVNVGYFQNAAERQLIRRGLTLKNDYALLDLARKAELMSEMCVFAAQSFDYISDTVDRSNRMKDKVYDPRLRQGMEDFHSLGVTLSGDCEDGGKLNQAMFKALLALVIDATQNPELFEMQRIARDYTAWLTLATVHGAKADDNTERIGAHMYLLWLPKEYVKQTLETNEEGRAVAARLPLDFVHAGLPVLFGEGTGRIHTLGTGPETIGSHMKTAAAAGNIRASHPGCFDPLINARRYVGANMRTKGGIKTEIPHDRGAASPFYLGNLLVVTSDFLDLGYNVGAFTMCQIQPDGQLTRGAMFTDIINSNSNVALIPCRPIPTPIMKIIGEATALRTPMRPFTLDKSKPMDGLEVHPLFERLKSSINSLKRVGDSPFGSVDLIFRPHQFDATSIDMMIADLTRMRHIHKVDYELEHMTNPVCTYRVMLYVNENAL